ncbi:MAG: zonular occludens toxin domain-containing protein [Sulfurospirillaceae bacterium]|nr:zonular occludens toxin domain-containing protein [Sulfurospirillaceae bacterium]
MIFGFVGPGGSGKSAVATSLVIENLSSYDIIITNVYKFNKDNSILDIAKQKQTEIEIIHFDSTHEDFIQVLNDIEIRNADLPMDEKFKILVVYDECHKALRRYSNAQDDDIYLSDFLSESRHLHCDFFLITQGIKKISDMYKGEFKAWYVAVDDQFKVSANTIEFRKMDQENKVKIGIKRFKKSTKWRGASGAYYKVFDLYDSEDDGDERIKDGMSFLAKKKYIFILAVLFTLTMFYFAFKSVHSLISSKDSKLTHPNSKIVSHSSDKNIKFVSDKNTTIVYSSRFDVLSKNLSANKIVGSYVSITCLYDSLNHLYIFPNRTLTEKNFDDLNKLFLLEIINIQIISENVYRYEYLVSSDLLPILQNVGVVAKKKGAI